MWRITYDIFIIHFLGQTKQITRVPKFSLGSAIAVYWTSSNLGPALACMSLYFPWSSVNPVQKNVFFAMCFSHPNFAPNFSKQIQGRYFFEYFRASWHQLGWGKVGIRDSGCYRYDSVHGARLILHHGAKLILHHNVLDFAPELFSSCFYGVFDF